MKASSSGLPVSFALSKLFKKSLLCTAILCAASGIQAQEAEDSEKEKQEKENEIEVIEVSGIFASSAKNLNIKRFSNSIVDAITAEDIGKFPDKNVADSLQRVPGVVIQRNGGEGSTVSIRGLSSELTFTQLNGNFIASSPGEPARSFDYALLPSAMIDTVEVFKSPQARLDEGGVGGTILMHTRKPLNMEPNSGVVQFESTYGDNTDEHEPLFTGVYSWANEDENLGFLVGYTRQQRTNRSLSGGVYNWRWTGSRGTEVDALGNPLEGNELYNAPIVDANGQEFGDAWLPQVVRSTVFEQERDREGLQFTAQWSPTDNLNIGMNYFRFELGLDSTTNEIQFTEWEYTSGIVTDVQHDASGNIVTGVDFSAGANGNQRHPGFPWITGKFTREESTSDTYDFFADYEGEGFTLSVKAGHTESAGGPVLDYDVAYYNGGAASYFGWSMEDQQLNIYMDPSMIANLKAGQGGNFDKGSSNSSFIVSDLQEDYAQVDLSFELDWSIFTTVHTGIKYRDASLHRESRNTFYLAPDFDVAAGEASPGGITRADSYQWTDGEPIFTEILLGESIGNFPAGVNTNIFPGIDWNAYHTYLTDNFQRYDRREDEFVYDVGEKITAGYVQADFLGDDYRGNFGVRVVKTETSGSSSDRIQYIFDYYDDAGEYIPVDDREVTVNEVITQVSSNTQVLPSFNFAYDFTDQLVLRTAIAKVMARPSYGSLGSQERLQWISNEVANDLSAINVEAGWNGRGGNKNLKPFLSNQIDLSIEYYYGEGSAVGFNAFYKDIDNFVVPLTITASRDLPQYDFSSVGETAGGPNTIIPEYTTSANGTNAESKGIEFFIVHNFENGFGFSSNYTVNDTNQADVSVNGEKIGESKLIGTSDFVFNSSVYFENDAFSARVSYNLRGKTTLGSQNGMQSYLDEHGLIDANVSFNISENLVATASVINLTEEETYAYLGDDTKDRFLSNSYSGRRFYGGITYKF